MLLRDIFASPADGGGGGMLTYFRLFKKPVEAMSTHGVRARRAFRGGLGLGSRTHGVPSFLSEHSKITTQFQASQRGTHQGLIRGFLRWETWVRAPF